MKIIPDEEFVKQFRDCIGSDDCMYTFTGTAAVACRIVELYKMWKGGRSFDAILEEMGEINFDLCVDDNGYCCIPQSAYDFCKEVLEVFDDNFCDDRKED